MISVASEFELCDELLRTIIVIVGTEWEDALCVNLTRVQKILVRLSNKIVDLDLAPSNEKVENHWLILWFAHAQ